MAASMTVLSAGVVDVPALPQAVPLRELLPWAIFAGVLLLSILYLVAVEQGAASVIGGHWMHEFVHDARHVLAIPCH